METNQAIAVVAVNDSGKREVCFFDAPPVNCKEQE